MTGFQIHPLNCGTIAGHRRAGFLYRSRDDGTTMDAPCVAWLLRDGRTSVLVDVGPGSRAHAGRFYTERDEGRDDLLADELARHQVDPTDVRTVILTHLHNDHVGGARLLPNARFHVQLDELKEAVWPVPFQRPIYETNQKGRMPAWAHVMDRLEVHEGDAQIMPGIRVLHLPGHTAGSQGVLVDTPQGACLIAGDLVPLLDNWPDDGTEPVPNGNHTDLRAYDASFSRLRALGARVLPAHEPRVFGMRLAGHCAACRPAPRHGQP